MDRLRRRLGALALGCLLAHCGRASEPSPRGEPGGWLAACFVDADCAVGACSCGLCTSTCAEADCSAGPPGSECVSRGHWAHDGFCAGRSTEPICVLPCTDASECGGSDRCVQGICLRASAADVSEARASPLCASNPVVFRSLYVSDQEQLDLLAGCESIQGDLTLELFPDADASALESLREVRGALRVFSTFEPPGMTFPLPPLPRLETAGDLFLNSVELGASNALPALRALTRRDLDGRAAGALVVMGCKGLTDLSPFGALDGITELQLLGNPELARLNGLGDAAALVILSLQGNERLSELGPLGSMPRLGSVEIADTPALTSLAGLSLPAELQVVDLSSNAGLETLAGLESIAVVDILSLRNLPALQTLEGLSGLESVLNLLITDNASLVSLAGLTALREVGELRVEHNSALASFGSWPAIEQIDRCSISDNAALASASALGTAVRFLEVSSSPRVDLSVFQGVSLRDGMSLEDLPQLVTLNGAPNLPPAGSLFVRGCPSLTDLSALSSLPSLHELELSNIGAPGVPT